METAASASEMPQLFGDAMHVDCEADAAVTNKRNPELFLTHDTSLPGIAFESNCVLALFCVFAGDG